MTKEDIKDFGMRICQGSKEDLVVTTFYIIDTYLEEGKKAYKKGLLEEFNFSLNKAKQFINNLTGSLNFKYPLAFELKEIYSYANKVIVSAIVKKNISEIEKVQDMLSKLRKGFEEANLKNEEKEPAIKGNQKVYAGLTYGKNSLNEYALRA